MKNLQLDKKTALKIYHKSSAEVKEILISTFGAECFSGKIIDRIKTFEDACNELGISNDSCRPIFDEDEDPDEIAYKKLKVIIAAVNEGWKPDWTDTNQKKWYPWFALSSGFGFSHSYYHDTYAYTAVGSRLCFPSQELSDYVATQFIDLYKQFITL